MLNPNPYGKRPTVVLLVYQPNGATMGATSVAYSDEMDDEERVARMYGRAAFDALSPSLSAAAYRYKGHKAVYFTRRFIVGGRRPCGTSLSSSVIRRTTAGCSLE